MEALVIINDRSHWQILNLLAPSQFQSNLQGAFFNTRETNSSTLESRSLRMGDWFDFL